MNEIISERTLRSKTYDLGRGKRRLEIAAGTIHVPADPAAYMRGEPSALEDIDNGFDADAQKFSIRNNWQGLEVSRSTIGYTYTSREKGETVQVELLEVGGQTFTVPAPVLDADGVWWMDAAPGVDINLTSKVGRVSVYKRIRNAAAPRSFLWRVTESSPGAINIQTRTNGNDNWYWQDPARLGTGWGRVRRQLVMAEPVITRRGRSWTFLEAWTGEVIARDANRVKSISTDASYPVVIDADINEAVTADADDGHEDWFGANHYWEIERYNFDGSHGIYDTLGSHYYFPGWRFQAVPTITNADTVDLAVLTLTFNFNGGIDPEPATTVFGEDVDSSAAFSDTHYPNNMTQTTASAAFPAWGNGVANGAKNITVTSIIAEIVARAGWSPGNNISLFALFTKSGVGAYTYIDDFAGAGAEAALAIDFTVPAAGGAYRPDYKRRANYATILAR